MSFFDGDAFEEDLEPKATPSTGAAGVSPFANWVNLDSKSGAPVPVGRRFASFPVGSHTSSDRSAPVSTAGDAWQSIRDGVGLGSQKPTLKPQAADQAQPPRAAGDASSRRLSRPTSNATSFASASLLGLTESTAGGRETHAKASDSLTLGGTGRIPIVSGAAAKASQTSLWRNGHEASAGVIDLVSDSDEDVQITGSTGPKRPAQPEVQDVVIDDSPVCIGQIGSSALIMYPISEISGRIEKTAEGAKTVPGPIGPLKVRIQRAQPLGANETLRVGSRSTGENFAVVEHRIANILGPLLCVVNQGTEAYIAIEATIMRKGEPNPMMLPLELLLFCRPRNVQMVARRLELGNLFLGHPISYEPERHGGARYSNPHGSIERVGEADRRRRELLGGTGHGGFSYGQRTAQRSVEHQREQVEAVFASLRSGVDMAETQPPDMICTPLYRHQKQALSFLLDRERLRTPQRPPTKPKHAVSVNDSEDDLISLWRQINNVHGQTVGWINVVTSVEIGAKTPPPQCRGAILADDMGLGKTIVIISLIAATLSEAKVFAAGTPLRTRDTTSHFDAIAAHPHSSHVKPAVSSFTSQPFGNGLIQPAATKKKKGENKIQRRREEAEKMQRQRLTTRSRATLIVCPLSTIQNWESQIEEHASKPTFEDTATPKLSICVYHGQYRTNDPRELADHDVVLTTFSTLASEYSRLSKAESKAAEEAEATAEVSADHDSDLEEVHSSISRVNGANGLLKAPLINGVSSTDTNTPNVTEDEGKSKKRRRRQKHNLAPLQMIEWFRVVLDEAHMIKEHSTIQAKAACELAAERRTCLTGTPLQNSLDDLFSLMRFLRLEPFTDRAIWNAYIGTPAKLGDRLGVSRLQLVMRHLALRRTKASRDSHGKPILDLPRRSDEMVYLQLDEAEKAFYSSHHTRYKHDFEIMLHETDTVLKNYCTILQELLRLRQICVHADLVRESEDANRIEGDVVEAIRRHGISVPRALQLFALLRDSGSAQCVECGHDLAPIEGEDVCEEAEVEGQSGSKRRKVPGKPKANADNAIDSVQRRILTRCTHLFCLMCFRKHVSADFPNLAATDRAACSACREEISPVLDAVEIQLADLEQMSLVDATDGLAVKKAKPKIAGQRSTKIQALLEDLLPFSQANPTSANYCSAEHAFSDFKEDDDAFRPHRGEVVKSVVFSQWVKLLDKVGDELSRCNIRFARLDGSMNRTDRGRAMNYFKIDPSCEILLVSLRAGGVGLNLTAAQRVYLLEPFWNPAVESQALDRVHRLGQTRPVKTKRLIIENSIEANMLKVQKRKQDLANLSMSATLSKSELAKQRVEDLRTLLQTWSLQRQASYAPQLLGFAAPLQLSQRLMFVTLENTCPVYAVSSSFQ